MSTNDTIEIRLSIEVLERRRRRTSFQPIMYPDEIFNSIAHRRRARTRLFPPRSIACRLVNIEKEIDDEGQYFSILNYTNDH